MKTLTDMENRLIGYEDLGGIDYIVRWKQEGEDGPYPDHEADADCKELATDLIVAKFSLVCRHCSRDATGERADAVAQGWTDIEFDPDFSDRNYNGCCPHVECQQQQKY